MFVRYAVHRKSFDSHTNDVRTIVGLLSPPGQNQISIEQFRVALVHEKSQLGNHYRDYGEIYGIIGEADFLLEDIETKERTVYPIKTGDQLYVPKGTALRITADKGTVIICCSEKHDRETGTHKYEFS